MIKTTSERKHRRTTMVPVTTMEELPVLDESERADLLKSLKDAETKIKAGEFSEYESKGFKERLRRSYRGAKR